MRPFAPFIVVGVTLFSLTSFVHAAEPAPSDNAATYYRQAFDALPKGDDVDRVFTDWQAVPLDGPTIKILRQCDPAIELMQHGASIKKCEWGLDYKKGLELEVPELDSAKRLAEATCLKIRYLCEIKRYDRIAALSADLMTLARHLSAQRMGISRMMAAGVESSGIHVACRYLPDLPVPVLQQLGDRLAKLPEPASFGDTLRNEGRMAAVTIKRAPATVGGKPFKDLPETPAGRAELADQVVAAFDKAAKDVTVPLHDLPGTQFKLSLAIVNPVSPYVGPFTAIFIPLQSQECRIGGERALLRAAVAVTLKGPDAAKAFPDPFGSGPLTCKPIEGGFEVNSSLPDKRKTLGLKTGPHALD